MSKISTYGQNKIIVGLVSLMSMLFVATPSFERNPQQCGMIRVIGKKNKDGHLKDEELPPANSEFPDS